MWRVYFFKTIHIDNLAQNQIICLYAYFLTSRLKSWKFPCFSVLGHSEPFPQYKSRSYYVLNSHFVHWKTENTFFHHFKKKQTKQNNRKLSAYGFESHLRLWVRRKGFKDSRVSPQYAYVFIDRSISMGRRNHHVLKLNNITRGSNGKHVCIRSKYAMCFS